MHSASSGWRIVLGVVVIAVALAAMTALSAPVSAQSPVETPAAMPVGFMEYQAGRLDDGSPRVVYSIELTEHMVFSVSAFMRTGDVVPQVTVYTPDRQVFGVGALPEGATDSSVVNALVAPVSGSYTIVLERTSGVGGDYILIVQPGYEYLYAWDDFDTYDPRLSLCWEPAIDLNSIWTLNNGEMVAHVLAPSITSANAPCKVPVFDEVYIQSDLHIANTPPYYEYGLEVYRSANANEYYAALFTSEGRWSVQYHNKDGWTPIQDWTDSPLIRPASSPVTIGLWAQDGTLSLYYNHQLVGRVTDPLRRAQSGTLALAASSGSDLPATVEVHFDNIVITGPRPTAP